MKNSIKLFSVAIMITMLLAGLVFGQSLEERLQSMVSTNAEMYMNPLATAFGSGMNSGWFHSAKPHKMLGFDFGVRAMMVTFPDDQKVFEFDVSQLNDYNFSESIEFNIDGTDYSYNVSMSAADLFPNTKVPTVLGNKEGVELRATPEQLVDIIENQLRDQGATEDVITYASSDINSAATAALSPLPDLTIAGIGFDYLPLVVPQAAVGLSLPMLPIKAEIVIRGLPEIELSEELGSFQFFGGGVKLALDPFIPIPMFPVNIAVGAYTQKMSLGTVFEANNTLLTLMAGKDLSLLLFGVGVYGAVGMETSNIKIKYDLAMADGSVTPIEFDMKGDNKFRTTIGGRIRLAVINISADYTMGADNVLTAGVGISIR